MKARTDPQRLSNPEAATRMTKRCDEAIDCYSHRMPPNRSSGILLEEGRFNIEYLGNTRSLLCRVTFDLTRDHHVLIDCSESLHELVSASGSPFPRTDQPFRISVPASVKPIDCIIAGPFNQQLIGDDPTLYLTFRTSNVEGFVETGSDLLKVEGEIANFDRCGLRPEETIRFSDGLWTSELIPTDKGSYPGEIQNPLYTFSHHLVLQRCDCQCFSWSEAQVALETLSTFLSFCLERWTAPTLVKGFNRAGVVAVQDWRTARIDPLRKTGNWLDELHSSAMVQVFPGFADLMKNDGWRETIRTAVYWYIRGNTTHVGPDGAIVLVQTALERLAWHILVRVRRSISGRDFSDLPAAGQLRLLLDACSVPLELPSRLKELTKVATGQKSEPDWVDGPQAFVAARNQIVHPGKRKRMQGGRMFYEALQLGKWYLELILLRSAGCNGDYACRLEIPRYLGSVEPVPWIAPKP